MFQKKGNQMKCPWRSRVSPVLRFDETKKKTVFGQEFQRQNLSPGLKHSRICSILLEFVKYWTRIQQGHGEEDSTAGDAFKKKRRPRHRFLHDRNSTQAPFLGQRLPKPAFLPA